MLAWLLKSQGQLLSNLAYITEALDGAVVQIGVYRLYDGFKGVSKVVIRDTLASPKKPCRTTGFRIYDSQALISKNGHSDWHLDGHRIYENTVYFTFLYQE